MSFHIFHLQTSFSVTLEKPVVRMPRRSSRMTAIFATSNQEPLLGDLNPPNRNFMSSF